MYSTIVVGTDGSETAERALGRAVELACLTRARLHVLTVSEPAPARVGGATQAGEPYERASRPDFQADVALERALVRLGAHDLEVEQHVRAGEAVAPAIIALAEQQGADLIVVGSKGMQGAGRLLGSVPNRVSHRSPCDVLIVATT